MSRIKNQFRALLLSTFILVSILAPSIHLPGNVVAPASSSFTFAAAGDFNRGPGDPRTQALLDRLQAAGGVAFLLALGDMGYGTDEQGWCNWTKARYNNILVITGNHDSDESGPSDISTTIQYCTFTLASQGVTVVGAPGAPGNGYGYAYYFDYPAV